MRTSPHAPDTATAAVVAVWGAATDVGARRLLNEDSYLAAPPLFLVADGMGGHQAGEVASATVIDEFTHLVGRETLTVDDVDGALQRARARVDALPHEGSSSAGTTLTGVCLAERDGAGSWLVVNLGDSRVYRHGHGALEQVSVDHSVVQELIDAGQLDAAAAASDSRRNVITRAIGAGSDGAADYWMSPATVGERMLVCSDGLHTELDADTIAGILADEADPQDAADRLVREAVAAGGRDNVTVIVVDAVAVREQTATPEFDDVPGADVPEFEDTLPREHGDTLPRVGAAR
jgi:PPM family protein phosphatase